MKIFMRKLYIIVFLFALLNIACSASQITERQVMEQAISNIKILMETSPKFRYKKIECLGLFPKEENKPSRRIRFMDGTWGDTSDLQDVLVFLGDNFPGRSMGTKGGRAYFYCDSNTGKLIGYYLSK